MLAFTLRVEIDFLDIYSRVKPKKMQNMLYNI